MKYLFLDTETGALEPESSDILQLAWTLTDEEFKPLSSRSYFMKRTLPATERAIQLNGLTDAFLKENSTDPYEVYNDFLKDLKQADVIVAHYAVFDKEFICKDCFRRISAQEMQTAKEIKRIISTTRTIDTKLDYIHLNVQWKERKHPGPYLEELCHFLSVETRELRFHRADADVEAMRLCMKQIKYIYSDTIPS